MRLSEHLVRIMVAGILAILLPLITFHPMWDANSDTTSMTTYEFARVMLTDWALPVIILGILLSMAMIGASYLVRDERIENLLWEQEEGKQ
ncbi:MAG: NADH-quinone oxidoreductase subunit J [Candidatus Thalassarchaeaceae archaeon]|jgi:NADH:ubiquinone oxidoreductase subunit 6 (subunit J)|nr:NADH-quinone oxidoreductase subunit J [Candidatus Thalassarchaeaceae archaeon]MDP7043020.1 NADH-quinone oxidoreductase subunit J [Candidatus Thalassarchaeaceae archaeon]DAC48581.1 MAG TPA: NADH-quinone oxidoreductase subunit J [Candidatus Poseidoniales archaeon]|tara:strand:+ start:970 stop:1242 length:273 start_codon:yes stop_codon:yes gene_type:complete